MIQSRTSVLQCRQYIEELIIGLNGCRARSRLIASNTSKLNLIQQKLNRKKLLIEAFSPGRLTHQKHQQRPRSG